MGDTKDEAFGAVLDDEEVDKIQAAAERLATVAIGRFRALGGFSPDAASVLATLASNGNVCPLSSEELWSVPTRGGMIALCKWVSRSFPANWRAKAAYTSYIVPLLCLEEEALAARPRDIGYLQLMEYLGVNNPPDGTSRSSMCLLLALIMDEIQIAAKSTQVLGSKVYGSPAQAKSATPERKSAPQLPSPATSHELAQLTTILLRMEARLEANEIAVKKLSESQEDGGASRRREGGVVSKPRLQVTGKPFGPFRENHNGMIGGGGGHSGADEDDDDDDAVSVRSVSTHHSKASNGTKHLSAELVMDLIQGLYNNPVGHTSVETFNDLMRRSGCGAYTFGGNGAIYSILPIGKHEADRRVMATQLTPPFGFDDLADSPITHHQLPVTWQCPKGLRRFYRLMLAVYQKARDKFIGNGGLHADYILGEDGLTQVTNFTENMFSLAETAVVHNKKYHVSLMAELVIFSLSEWNKAFLNNDGSTISSLAKLSASWKVQHEPRIQSHALEDGANFRAASSMIFYECGKDKCRAPGFGDRFCYKCSPGPAEEQGSSPANVYTTQQREDAYNSWKEEMVAKWTKDNPTLPAIKIPKYDKPKFYASAAGKPYDKGTANSAKTKTCLSIDEGSAFLAKRQDLLVPKVIVDQPLSTLFI